MYYSSIELLLLGPKCFWGYSCVLKLHVYSFDKELLVIKFAFEF